MQFKLWIETQHRPREFYRGSDPGNTQRIKTGAEFWDSLLFVADNPKSASFYGKYIEKIIAKPEARILYEGSKDFRSIAKGLSRNMKMREYCDLVAQRAKAAGYHAVWFKHQTDIGTAILDTSMFVRGTPEPYVTDTI